MVSPTPIAISPVIIVLLLSMIQPHDRVGDDARQRRDAEQDADGGAGGPRAEAGGQNRLHRGENRREVGVQGGAGEFERFGQAGGAQAGLEAQ